MALTNGTRLGPYEIIAPLGAGGMGEVYRARDTRLGRDVAIKVLPESYARDSERLRRFEQEARTIAALNHPNLLAIHDVGEHSGTRYLVSELLDGESLRAVLNRGALPQRKALDYAVQIAQGLAAAHGKTAVHRDLKPENIFLTRDGRVKILDFGLAKLARPGGHVGEGATVDAVASPQTSPGVVLGTVGYMSPEQVRGDASDHRSDIFTFGSVLYEMLSGGRAFKRDTSAETMTAILREEPPELNQSGHPVPPTLERIVRRCLEKAPEQRFQSAKDLGFALEAMSGSTGTAPALPALPAMRIPFSASTVFGMIVLVLASIVGGFFLGRPRHAIAPQFFQVTHTRGSYIRMARFTPDGQTVVFGATTDGAPMRLWFQRTDSAESSPLPLPPADLLSISARGELAIALNRNFADVYVPVGLLARVPMTGGAPRELLEGVTDADWSPDGSGLAVVRGVGGRFRLEYPIGKVLYETTGYVSHIRFSPQGDRIAFMDHPIFGDDRGYVSVVDLAGNRKVLTGEAEAEQGLAWASGGGEIWYTAGLAGEDRAVRGVTLSGHGRVILSAPGNLTLHDISRDGRVLLDTVKPRIEVAASVAGQDSERDLTWFDMSFNHKLSADGKILAFNTNAGGGTNYAIKVSKTDGSPPVRLADGLLLALSLDAKWVLATPPTEDNKLVVIPIGAGETKTLTSRRLHYRAALWLSDNQHILANAVETGQALRAYLEDLSSGESKAVAPEGVNAVLVSPDGKSFLGQDAGGKFAVYPLGGSGSHEAAGLGRGDTPIQWLRDGRTVLVLRPGEIPISVRALDLVTGNSKPWKQIVPSDRVALVTIRRVLVTPDGQQYAYTADHYLSTLYIVEGLK